MPTTKSVRLPKLMLVPDIRRTLDLLSEVDACGEDIVHIDADALEFAEPLPLCLLAAQLNRLHAQGRAATVERLRPEVAERLRNMNVLGDWLEEKSRARYQAQHAAPFQVCWASSYSDADTIANTLADKIVAFVPGEYKSEDGSMSKDPVRMPLAYVLTEVLDNSLSHGRGRGFDRAVLRSNPECPATRRSDCLRMR